MSYEITFDKTRYHSQDEMCKWCKQYIGPGGWSYASPKDWSIMDNKLWVIHCMFGNTTFAFREEKHYTWFILRWQ